MKLVGYLHTRVIAILLEVIAPGSFPSPRLWPTIIVAAMDTPIGSWYQILSYWKTTVWAANSSVPKTPGA